MNAVIDLLQSHRSIRQFTDEPIPEALFRELMRAGQSAATSSHVQATSVIRVKDPGKRERIAELAGGQAYVAACAEFLVFCADMKRLFDTCERNANTKTATWSEQIGALFTRKARPHMREFLRQRGFGMQ